MRRLAAAAAVALALGCSTTAPAPAPEPKPQGPSNQELLQRLDEIQASLTELNDRLEVTNARIARVEAGSPPAMTAAPAAPAAETPAVAEAPEAPPAPAPASVAAAPSRSSAPILSRRAEPAPAPAHTAPATPSPRPAPVSDSVQGANIADMYRHALATFGKSAYAEARREFEAVLQADPGGDLADNALYWIGETWFASQKYGEAMTYYQKVLTDYPEENKAPDSMLKIGLCYVRQGDLLLARKEFDELIRRYPYSTPASAAKNELKRIKY